MKILLSKKTKYICIAEESECRLSFQYAYKWLLANKVLTLSKRKLRLQPGHLATGWSKAHQAHIVMDWLEGIFEGQAGVLLVPSQS